MAGHGHTHGIFMWTCFLVLFPLGTILVRTPRSAFQRHWIVQLVTTLLSLTGAFIGLSHTHFRVPSSHHTVLGSLVSLFLILQAILGWRHHVRFLAVRKRTWLSHVHIWLGRAIVLGGWTNIMIGMSHHKHHILGVSASVLAGALIVVEGVGIGTWLWVAERRRRIAEGEKGVNGEEGVALTAAIGARRGGDHYFALGISDDEADDDDDDDGKKERKSVEVGTKTIGVDSK